MFRKLVANTLISAVAFVATAAVPLLLVPLIVGHYGIVIYGLVVVARILLPTGGLAIFDFGNAEIATQAVVRARHDQDWLRAGRQLRALGTITLGTGLIVAVGLGAGVPYLAALFKAPMEARAGFEQIIVVTAVVFTPLLMGLVAEGVLKGFEAFRALRVIEVSCALGYGVLTVAVVFGGLGYQWIALTYLASLLLRAVMVTTVALRLLGKGNTRYGAPQLTEWQDVRRRCRLMAGNRTLGAAQSQAAPLLIGAFLGAGAVGVYDLIIRFPRFLKVVIGLMNTAVLPVSSRLDVTEDKEGMQRLGEIGLLGVVAVAAPICVWGATFSEPVLRLWVGSSYSVYWPWQSLMFLVPLINAMTSFGGGALLGRPHVVARLNTIALAQIVLQLGLGLGLMSTLHERAYILGQAIAVLLSFPFQMWLISVEKQLSPRMFVRHVVIVSAVTLLAAVSFLIGATGWVSTIFDLVFALLLWLVLSYVLMWLFILRPAERKAFSSLIHVGHLLRRR